jgi:hypothetical protein
MNQSVNKEKILFLSDQVIWNTKKIEQPMFKTVAYTKIEYQNVFNIKSILINICKDLKIVLTNHKQSLLFEQNIMSKMIYKNFNTLRKDKAFQSVKKLQRLLKSFQELEIEMVIKSIMPINENERIDGLFYLPPREFFEFILTKLFSALKILKFIKLFIKSLIFFNLINSTKNSIFLSNNILFLSTISRIYFVKNEYLKHLHNVYIFIKDKIFVFKSTNYNWSEKFDLNLFQVRSTTKTVKNYQNRDIKKLDMKIDNDFGENVNRESINLLESFELQNSKKTHESLLFKKMKLWEFFVKKLRFLVETYFNRQNISKKEKNEFKKKVKFFLKRKIKNQGFEFSNFLKDLAQYPKKLRNNIKFSIFQEKKNLCDDLKKYIIKKIVYLVKISVNE